MAPRPPPEAPLGDLSPSAGQAGTRAGPYYVFGRRASNLEWYTYLSLRRLGWQDRQIRFQVPYLAGRLPGGVVLDFVVWAPSGPHILEPNGDYWHRSALQLVERTRARKAAIRAAWRGAFYYLILAESDFVSEAVTDRELEGFLGRG